MIRFVYPYLALLFFLPFFLRRFSKTNQLGSALRVPFIKDFEKIQQKFSSKISFTKTNHSPVFWLLMLIWFLITLALMRPVEIKDPIRLQNKGRDILLVTDISTSMLEDDFVFNTRRIARLEAVRAVVSDFVSKRLNDRLGLVLFGTRAYLQAPLTFDRQAVLDVLSSMKAGMAGQSTAIGDAVALALKALKESANDKKNQLIILLTDGQNNDGQMSLPQAINLAKNEGVKVYTIGIGAPSLSMASAFFGLQNQGLDEKDLKKLAQETKGSYFKVTTLADLIKVYREIDKIESDDFNQNYIYPQKELYFIPLVAALLIALSVVFFSVLRRNQDV